MATYLELRQLEADTPLLDRTMVAVAVAAQIFIDDAGATAEQLGWAQQALRNPRFEAERVLRYVLAVNKAVAVAAIQAAPDSTLQTNVNAAAAKLATGYVPGS